MALCCALTLAAAVPRFVRLGALSFSGDEDITALVASSVNRGEGSYFPSGMEYRRALPYTWVVAAAVRVFGERSEAAHRIPSALLGTLTVPLLFLFGRYLIGERAALLAALLMAFSQSHLLISREARMYAPFLFFYVATAFAWFGWVRSGQFRYLMLGLAAAVVAITFHLIGVLVVLAALVPYLFIGYTNVPLIVPGVVAAALGIATWAYQRFFVNVAYAGWVLPAHLLWSEPTDVARSFLHTLSTIQIVLAVTGAAIGIWTAIRTGADGGTSLASRVRVAPLRWLALFSSATVSGFCAGTGQLYGLGIAGAIFLLVHPTNRRRLASQLLVPGVLLFLVGVAGAGIALSRSEPGNVLRRVLEFPQPYGPLLALELPAVCLLFAIMLGVLALRAPTPHDYGLRTAALMVLLPWAALGLSERAPMTRFAVGTYPFLLLLSAAALIAVFELVTRGLRKWNATATLVAALIVVLSGAVIGHGIPAAVSTARMLHGQQIGGNEFSMYPDHAAPGEFVRRSRRPGDVVMAEDPLQQGWYAGPIDYWFRRYGDAAAYLYQAPDGRLRDQYVGSAIVADPLLIDSVQARTRGRVWFISSGETQPLRSWYLSPQQARWLDSLEHNRAPVFVGRDQASRVYCLNCSAR